MKNLDNLKYSHWKKLIKEVAIELDMNEVFIEKVLDTTISILIEKISNREKVTIKNIVTFDYRKRKFSSFDDPSIIEEKEYVYPRISDTLRKMYKLQNNLFSDKPYYINRYTWKDALKWAREGHDKEYKNK